MADQDPQAHRDLAWWRSFAQRAKEPLAGAILFLANHDPDVLSAVDDVDVTLIDAWLAMPVEQRMRYAIQTALDLEGCRLVRT